MATSTRMSAAERREQLLDVTKRLVAARGFHAVSIEAVAREAGVTRPIIYGHFGDLGGLLEALVERESLRALTQLAAILPSDLAARDAREQLLRALDGYLRVAEADPATWRLVLMPPEGAPSVLRERIAAGREAIVAALAQSVPGGIGSPDPELTARLLSTVADESVRMRLTEPDRFSRERLLSFAEWYLDRLTR